MLARLFEPGLDLSSGDMSALLGIRSMKRIGAAHFVLRVLRPLRCFGLVECRGEDATRTGHGEWRKAPLFDRFVQFDPALAGTGTATLH